MASTQDITDVVFEFSVTGLDTVKTSATQAQASFQAVGGAADQATAEFSALKQASDAMAAGFEKATGQSAAASRSFASLQRQLDPVGAAVSRTTAALEQLERRYQSGRISAEQYSQLQSAGTARLDQAKVRQEAFNKTLSESEDVSKKLQFAMRDLGLQSIDMFQGIATGAPILRTFIQQGSQVVQVNAAMGVGFRQMAGAIAGTLLNPLTLVTAAIVAVGAAVVATGVHFESVERQINGIGNALRGTHTDWQSLATDVQAAGRAVAQSMDTARADATAAVQAIASSPAWAGTTQQLEHLGVVATQMSLVLGGSAADNAKLLAKALTEPGEVAKELGDRHLPTMTAALEHAIQRFDESGRTAQGYAEVLKAVEQAVGGVENNTTEIQKAMKELDQAFKDATGSGSGFAESIGDAFRSAAATAIQMVAETIKAIGDLVAAAKGVAGQIGKSQLGTDAANIGQFDIPGGGGVGSAAQGRATAQFQDPYRHAQMFPSPLDQLTGGAAELPLSGSVGGPRRPFSPADASFQAGRRLADSLGDPKGIEKINDQLERMRALRAAATNPEDVKAFDAAIKRLTDDLANATKGTKGHKDATEDLLASLGRTTAKLNLQADQLAAVSAAMDQSGAAANRLTASFKAQEDIAGKDTRKLTAEQIKQAIDAQTEAQLRLIDAQNRSTLDQQSRSNENATAIINVQTQALGQNADETERVVEAMKVQQDLLAKGIPLEDASAQRILASTDALVQAKQAYRETSQSIAEITNFIDRTMDNIGSAIVDAFMSGQGAAVNFANLAKSVLASLAQEFVKLSLINPLKSLLTGEFHPTLGSVVGAFDGSSRGTGIETYADPTANAIRVKVVTGAGDTVPGLFLGQRPGGGMGQADFTSFLPIPGQPSGSPNLGNAPADVIGMAGGGLDTPLGQGFASANQDPRSFYDLLAFSTPFGASFSPSGAFGSGLSNNVFSAPTFAPASSFGGVSDLSAIAGIAQAGSRGGGSAGSLLQVAGLANQLTRGSLFSPINSFLSQGLFGTSLSEAAIAANTPASVIGMAGGGLDAPLSAGIAPSGLLGGASLGSLIGGVGAGFGLGSMAGGMIQGALGKTGPAPMIGAGVGAVAGAVIGSVIPVIGTLIGGIIGGLIGGGGGGFIGPKAPSPYSATFVDIQDGQLVAVPGLSGNQLMPTNVQMAQNQATDFNRQLNALNLRITGTGTPPPAGAETGLGFFGQAKNPAGIAGLNINDVFSNVRFGAGAGIPSQTVDVLNRDIGGKAFESFEKLAAEVSRVRTFVEQTVPSLVKLGTASGSLQDSIDALNKQFDPALATARELGYAENELTDARDKAIQKARDAATYQFSDLQEQYSARFSAAAATLSADPEVGRHAVMQAFDLQANEQRKALSDQLTNVYGDTIKQTQFYADQMLGLERALGAERLVATKAANQAIEQQYEQARQSATQIIKSISEYARGLQYSAATPLSPQMQLQSAQREFNAVSGSALAGNPESLQKLTGYADTLLSAGRAVYGSGEGYVAIFRQVTDALNKVGEISPDTLTANIFAVETRSQTASLVQAIADLKSEVAGLRAQVAAGSAMPSRLAA